jgi:hypothetical protein
MFIGRSLTCGSSPWGLMLSEHHLVFPDPPVDFALDVADGKSPYDLGFDVRRDLKLRRFEIP